MRYCEKKFSGIEGNKREKKEEKGRKEEKNSRTYMERKKERLNEYNTPHRTAPQHNTTHQHITKLFKTTLNNTAHNSQHHNEARTGWYLP